MPVGIKENNHFSFMCVYSLLLLCIFGMCDVYYYYCNLFCSLLLYWVCELLTCVCICIFLLLYFIVLILYTMLEIMWMITHNNDSILNSILVMANNKTRYWLIMIVFIIIFFLTRLDFGKKYTGNGCHKNR